MLHPFIFGCTSEPTASLNIGMPETYEARDQPTQLG